MADKYINATKALNNVKKFQTEGDDFALVIKELAENLFNKLPAADVVEIVRCKDCKHWCEPTCQIKVSQHGLYSDDYCSYGERKADNG